MVRKLQQQQPVDKISKTWRMAWLVGKIRKLLPKIDYLIPLTLDIPETNRQTGSPTGVVGIEAKRSIVKARLNCSWRSEPASNNC